ncbi:hypothetical protein [Nocardioides sp.]|uniref:hypothetical protein n=1 Tax=Nocardioides sp. TaxID=35761 RepID=UPI003510F00C
MASLRRRRAALARPVVRLTASLARTALVAPPPTAVAAPGGGDPGPARAAAGTVGQWRVLDLGAGRYDVSWRSPTPLPVTGDRPEIVGADLAGGVTTLGADGRTVSAVVTAPVPPQVADLDVVLSGDRLDETGRDGAAVLPRAATAPARAVLDAADPGAPGEFAVVSSDYELAPLKLPGMKEPIERIGHVVEPAPGAETGPRPLVLFLHGRHEVCYDPTGQGGYAETWPCPAPFAEIPSHLGYDYVQRVLASQGYTTVSIRANGINAQDYRLPDGGAEARSLLVQRHLDHWVDLADEHQVDLTRVVLVGHSRGGEGVNRAAQDIPLSAPYRVVGQVLLAPTDFASTAAPYVPTLSLLPSCDGDVFDLQGQRFVDVGRDLAADDTALRTGALVIGANHNFFNTEWTPATAVAPANDDWFGPNDQPCGRATPQRLSAREQRAVGTAYVAGAVHVYTGDTDPLPLLDGSATTVPSIGDATVFTHALKGGRDTRRPGVDATPALPTAGAEARICQGVATADADALSACGRGAVSRSVTPHWYMAGESAPTRRFLEVAWSRVGARAGLLLDRPLDLSTDRLELRTVLDPARGPVPLQVRLVDGTGASVTLDPVGGPTQTPPFVGPQVTKVWATSLLVDAAGAPEAAEVDLADIREVDLVAGSERGRVWIADLSAAPADLPAVPARRLARVDLGTLTVVEGDSPERRLVRLPFRVVGEITAPARLQAVTVGSRPGDVARLRIDLAPGQTSGSIPVPVTADQLDDLRTSTQVSIWAASGVVTGRYLGEVRVTDDDPTPTMRATLARSTVREGQDIVLRYTLGAPVDYELYGAARFVRAPGRYLSTDDVPVSWLTRQGIDPDGDVVPLWRSYVYIGERLPTGEQRVEVRIPTRADGVREGAEKVRLKLEFGRTRVTREVTVVDAR